MLGRAYFTRQILTLLRLAQSTADPKFAAFLLDKAVDLKSRAEEVPPVPDIALSRQTLKDQAASMAQPVLVRDFLIRADRP